MGRFEELLDRLERLGENVEMLAEVQRREVERSNNLLALFRSGRDDLLFAGTVLVPSGTLTYSFDATVPFAAVGIADANKLGPITASTDATGATTGPGTATLDAGDVATVPMVGRHLEIVASKAGALFLAVYARPKPLAWSTS